MTDDYLLDTNIVTAILRKNPQVADRLRAALASNARVFISAVVYYEIKRGLLKRDASRQLAAFEEMVRHLEWLDVERTHWDAAAALWAESRRAGAPINDADLLLAAQARQIRAVVVTDDDDFDRLGVP
ncbi:MAG TPA: type II toxin-antitoxin system VapC family toxin, partial [Chloroflexi bacterium]|nr:type II toxin-antitoxin system VapC family toxin [Chloroflexota bacterium]